MNESRLLLSVDISIRWGDMDAFHHVNNSVYSTYLEEARLRWFNSLNGSWVNDQQAPVVANMKIDFRRPINWPGEISIELYAGRVGNSSVTLPFRMIDRNDPKILYAEGETILVWIAPKSGKPVTLPDSVRQALSVTMH